MAKATARRLWELCSTVAGFHTMGKKEHLSRRDVEIWSLNNVGQSNTQLLSPREYSGQTGINFVRVVSKVVRYLDPLTSAAVVTHTRFAVSPWHSFCEVLEDIDSALSPPCRPWPLSRALQWDPEGILLCSWGYVTTEFPRHCDSLGIILGSLK